MKNLREQILKTFHIEGQFDHDSFVKLASIIWGQSMISPPILMMDSIETGDGQNFWGVDETFYVLTPIPGGVDKTPLTQYSSCRKESLQKLADSLKSTRKYPYHVWSDNPKQPELITTIHTL
jgi:hypothetical protein